MRIIIDYFIGHGRQWDFENQRRVQLIVFGGMFAGILNLFNTAIFYKIGYIELSVSVLISSLVFLAVPFILKITKSVLISGNVFMLNGTLIMAIASYFSGNLCSVIVMWFCAVPLVGALLIGRKAALVWGGIACNTIACFYLMRMSGYAFPEPLALTDGAKNLWEFSMKFGIVLFVTVSCFYYEGVLNKAYKQVTELAGRQAVITAMRPAMETMTQTADTLTNSSTDMSSLASRLVEKSQTMTQRSQTVAAASEQMSASITTTASTSEEMSVSITNISSTSEEMAQNVSAVASAMEEMSSGINNIAQDARQGSEISVRSIQQAEKVTTAINTLGEATKNIGKITQFIKQIAEQTNLLALNATIEAASAGNAGKGFAVIAHEIKELANQSGRASEKIEDQINAVQRQTEDSVTQIAQIADIITQMNRSSLSITRAVEQHHFISDEIAANLQQAGNGVMSIAANIAEIARGAEDMSANAGQTDISASQVASNIRQVSLAAGENEAEYQKVNASAAELADVAQELQRMTDQFRDTYLDKV
jgi:methyl-accepting chemotaxis protein